MKIAYSCNDYYISQTGISMISLFENNREADEITVYLISKDISHDNIMTLSEICESYHRKLVVIDFCDIAYDLKLSSVGRHIETIYSKIFFSRIEGLNKIIYLDSDTVVVGSLGELWNDSLDGFYFGVVETFPSEQFEVLGLSKRDRVFNDGMAVVNVDYCRNHHLIEKALEVVDYYNGNPPILSEGVLNKVCYGKVKYISPRYNLLSGILYSCKLDSAYLSQTLHYSEEELKDSCVYPVVIHYLSSFYNRPWFQGCTHPYKDAFYKYKAISPWKDDPLKVNNLPAKRIWMDRCYRWFGYRNSEILRKVLNVFK